MRIFNRVKLTKLEKSRWFETVGAISVVKKEHFNIFVLKKRYFLVTNDGVYLVKPDYQKLAQDKDFSLFIYKRKNSMTYEVDFKKLKKWA